MEGRGARQRRRSRSGGPADHHVYLVSCKYLSDILFNVSPTHVFDDLLVGGQSRRGRGLGGDWFAEAALEHYQKLYAIVRREVHDGSTADLKSAPAGTDSMQPMVARASVHEGRTPQLFGAETQRSEAATTTVRSAPISSVGALPERVVELHERTSARPWPHSCGDAGQIRPRPPTANSRFAVAQASVLRWRRALEQRSGAAESMLWRLLRIGECPVLRLGLIAHPLAAAAGGHPVGLAQLFVLDRLSVFAQTGGQPRVGWLAEVRERSSGQVHEVHGHVEIRWSHGRFGGPPEAKGYLDSGHHLVPGYFELA